MAMINPAELELREETVVRVNRVAKVTARGKRFRFASIVVVGDGKGHVGIGQGKANEVMSSISKAKEDAKQNLVRIPVINGTIPHKITAKYSASKVMLKPAAPGTGIIAGAAVRSVMEQVGIQNILTKRYGSSNSLNVVKATLTALKSLRDAVTVANKRGMKIKEVFGS
ncbi:MAG: 30S ribosomal protein S5 [Candidatus Marinimicrobia bacterium]|jgi:small subunit ribosomal protein S5|nr:30S ribosomal protein S5 [Candidatus Neomarinimicrobiota bacterium]MDP6790116.1 30S ribosomal protein S5 [Candidatus Neomarinimicrobiota bacterium]MDP7072226.1 30S ribosomal protein S5 [Candidatus Neomarinimicrobiota bacterium]